MGYKSRSNFAPCYSMTDEQFNKIFKKDEKIENKNIQKNIDYVDPLYQTEYFPTSAVSPQIIEEQVNFYSSNNKWRFRL